MKARVIVIVLVVGFVAAIAARLSGAKQAKAGETATGPAAPVVSTTRVTRADLSEKVALTGNIRPKNEVDVFTKVQGRVAELHVKVGDHVKAGQVLAVVEHTEISLQAKTAAAAVQMATAGVRLAEAGLEGSKLDFDRTKALAEAGSAPQAQLDGARIKLQVSEAQLAQAKGQLAQAEASKALAEQQVANARIETPISGVVTRRNVDVGRNAGMTSPAFTVQDAGALKLETSVDAVTATRLERGRPVDITVDAWPGELFTGRIDLLSPTLDSATRRAAVEVLVDRAGGKLLPNTFAKAFVSVRELPKTLVVPKAAVLEQAGGAIVYRLNGGKVELVKPEFGPTDGKVVSVQAGLNEGDEVIVGNLAALADGTIVKVASPTPVTLNERPVQVQAQ